MIARPASAGIPARCGAIMLSIGLSFFFVGCASTHSVSNKASDYQERPKRFYVVLDGEVGVMGPTFPADFQPLFVSAVRGCGGEATVDVISALELDGKRREAAIVEFRPDALLIVRVTNVTLDAYGSLLTVGIDSRLLAIALDRVVWRSSSTMNAGGMFGTATARAQSFSAELMKRLQQDQILSGCQPISVS